MAKRDNHYEAAFEAYLQRRRTSYVAVDEARRSPLADGSLKSLDFIVSPTTAAAAAPEAPADAASGAEPVRWLVDVKGRQFPSGRQKRYWKNWLTREDLRSMAQWERLFGPQFGGLYVFAYNIVGDRSPVPAENLFEFRSRLYGFVAIRFADYARLWRPLSSSWDTVAIRTRWFRAWAQPFEAFLDGPATDSGSAYENSANGASAYGGDVYDGGADRRYANDARLEAARTDDLRGDDGASIGARFPDAPDDVMDDLFTPAGW